jgi:hypothetical protein
VFKGALTLHSHKNGGSIVYTYYSIFINLDG